MNVDLLHPLSTLPAAGLIAVKATVATLLALALVAAARRARASVRHLLLTVLFVFLLLLPLVARFAPAHVITVAAPPAAAAGPTVDAPSAPADGVAEREAAAAATVPVDWAVVARNVYIAGLAIMLITLAAGVWRLRAIASGGEVWLEGTALMNEIAYESGIRRAVLVVRSRETTVPLTFGFRRSTILLPEDAAQWSDEELRRAIRHELEHVRREDWAFQLAARAACAVYWPHPLVWVAWRRFCFEAERACDDAVVASRGTAGEYAGQLVSLARSVRRVSTLPALGMASRSRLARRIDALLDASQPRGALGTTAIASGAAAALALLVTIAPARLIAATADTPRAGADEARAEAAPAETFVFRSGGPLAEAFVKSAERGRIDDVKRLISAGVDVNIVARGDGTPLIGAARGGQLETVLLLLDNGADVNLGVRGDGNPLIAAARRGHAEVVRVLLERGAEIDRVVPGDENALIQAAWNGHADVVALLIGWGADVNVRVVERGEVRTALRMASRSGHDAVVRILLAAGARE